MSQDAGTESAYEPSLRRREVLFLSLEQLEGAGYSPVYGCRMGACHTCTCTKLSGIVKDMTTGQHSSSDREVIKICISAAVTHVALEL